MIDQVEHLFIGAYLPSVYPLQWHVPSCLCHPVYPLQWRVPSCLCHLYIPFSDMSFMSFCLFSSCSFIVEFDRSLDFLETRPWQLPGLQILSSLWALLFIISQLSSRIKFFILMRFSFSIFLFTRIEFYQYPVSKLFPGLGTQDFPLIFLSFII